MGAIDWISHHLPFAVTIGLTVIIVIFGPLPFRRREKQRFEGLNAWAAAPGRATERVGSSETGPATLNPGPELPAVAYLLVYMIGNGWKSTRAASLATLLDLAARGHIYIVAAANGALLCDLPRTLPSEPLVPFEALTQTFR
jgi:hypothetical protein